VAQWRPSTGIAAQATGGRKVDKVHFPYRSDSHLPFLHVIAESGAWQKHGLEVEYDYYISSDDAHREVANGSVEFVGGNHVSTYARRASGDRWVYLAQSVALLNHRLIATPESGIASVADLRGKVVGNRGEHPGLNAWLFLRQNGLDGDVKLETVRDGALWETVRDRRVDAAFVTPPADLFARRAGLNVIDIDFLPMVWFTTVSSGLPFVEANAEIVDRFLRGFCEGIAYYKTHRDESVRVIRERYKREGDLDEEAATYLYEDIERILLRKPYPSVEAIANVYEEAKKQDPAAERIDPMSLWDLHYLRRVDDSGFIDALYRG
jgi:ABC-type nitrate/sulfonate/bicarbonate transport system substrate-binding protein